MLSRLLVRCSPHQSLLSTSPRVSRALQFCCLRGAAAGCKRRLSTTTADHTEHTSNVVAKPSFFRGVYPIMITPFQSNSTESIDVEGFRKSIQFMAATGVQGITVLGVMGESNKMLDTEREILIRNAVEVARDFDKAKDTKFRVCVGTSHAGAAATAALSQMAQECGADAVMITPTSTGGGGSPSPKSIVDLYRRVGETCPGLPIVLQDHPASSGVQMSARLIAEIVVEVPSVKCIKMEAVPTSPKIVELKQIWSDDASLAQPPGTTTILTGLGALYGGYDLEQNSDGFMAGFAFPEILLAMHRAAQRGDYERAFGIYARYLPLIVFEQQPGVAVRKEIYRRRELIREGIVRAPAAPPIDPVLNGALERQLRRSFGDNYSEDITRPLPSQILIPLPDERSRARQLSSMWYSI